MAWFFVLFVRKIGDGKNAIVPGGKESLRVYARACGEEKKLET